MSKTESKFIIKGRVGKGIYHNTSKSGTKTTNFNVGIISGKGEGGNYLWESMPVMAFGHLHLETGKYYIITGKIGGRKNESNKTVIYLLADGVGLLADNDESALNGPPVAPPQPTNESDNFYKGNSTYSNNFDAGMNNAPDDTDIPF